MSASNEAQIIDLGQRLSANETRTDSHEKHLDRVDASLEKLTEVSISLKEIVKHQDNAIRGNHSALQTFGQKFDTRTAEVERSFTAIREDLAKIERDFADRIDSLKDEVTKSVDDIKGTVATNASFLEKWKWVLMGAGFVLYALLNHSDKVMAIMGSLSAK